MPRKADFLATALSEAFPEAPATGQGSVPTCILRLRAACRLCLFGARVENRVTVLLPLKPSRLRCLPYPPYRPHELKALASHAMWQLLGDRTPWLLTFCSECRQRLTRGPPLRATWRDRVAHLGRNRSPLRPRSSAISVRCGWDSGPRSKNARPRPTGE